MAASGNDYAPADCDIYCLHHLVASVMSSLHEHSRVHCPGSSKLPVQIMNFVVMKRLKMPHCLHRSVHFPTSHVLVNFLSERVKLSLCLTSSALRHEGVWRSGCVDPHFVDLRTGWRRVVSFTPRPLYTRERAPSTHWIGGWVSHRAGLDDVEKRKFFTLPELTLRPLGRPARS
jgi:hypothetical protein